MDYLEIYMNRMGDGIFSSSSVEEEQVSCLRSPLNNHCRKKPRCHENPNQHKLAEVFRKDLISAMKIPDTSQLVAADYWVLHDSWRMEWEKGVQVPVNPVALPKAHISLVPKQDNGDFRMPRKMIKFTPDVGDKETIDVTVIVGAKCRYDLDELDIAWLQIYNEEQSHNESKALTECTLELVMEELEMQCHQNMQVAIQTKEGLGIEYDESIVCDVCRSPECEEENEMVFCDGCDLCVHQACYGILKVPEGSWLCKPCALGVRSSIKCVLCGKRTGAMKSTRSGRKWAHLSCALWIPEVNIADPERMEPITKLSRIPPSRWSLVCSICKEKNVGACIQCSVHHCVTAFHVTCALEKRYDMITESRSSESSQTSENAIIFRSYCKKHGKGFKQSVESTGRKRLDQTDETGTNRQKRIAELEEEFQSFVSSEAVVNALNVKSETAFRIMEYWTLKRKANFCHPLLNPNHCGKDLEEVARSGLKRRSRMFMHLRQDLERVRNLCYMLGKREKIKRSAVKNMENVFLTQINYIERRMSVSSAFNPRNLVPSIPKFAHPEVLWLLSEEKDAPPDLIKEIYPRGFSHKSEPLNKKSAYISRSENASCRCEVDRTQGFLPAVPATRHEQLQMRKLYSSDMATSNAIADSCTESESIKSPTTPSSGSVAALCSKKSVVSPCWNEGRALKRKIRKVHVRNLMEKRKRSIAKMVIETEATSEAKQLDNKCGTCLVTRSSLCCAHANSISAKSNESKSESGQRKNSHLSSAKHPKIPAMIDTREAQSCNINGLATHVSDMPSRHYPIVSLAAQAKREANGPSFIGNLKGVEEDQSKVNPARLHCSSMSTDHTVVESKIEIEPCFPTSKVHTGLKWVSVVDDNDIAGDERYYYNQSSGAPEEFCPVGMNDSTSVDFAEVPEQLFQGFYKKHGTCHPMMNGECCNHKGNDLKLKMLPSPSFASNGRCDIDSVSTTEGEQAQKDPVLPAVWDLAVRWDSCTCKVSTHDTIQKAIRGSPVCSSSKTNLWHGKLYPIRNRIPSLMNCSDSNLRLPAVFHHKSQSQVQSYRSLPYSLPGEQRAYANPEFSNYSMPSWAQPLAMMATRCPLPIFYQYPPLPLSQHHNSLGIADLSTSTSVQQERSCEMAYAPMNSVVPAAVELTTYSGPAETTFCSNSRCTKAATATDDEQEWEVVTSDTTATSMRDGHRRSCKRKKKKKKGPQRPPQKSSWSGKMNISPMFENCQKQYHHEKSSLDNSSMPCGGADMEISTSSPLVIKVGKANLGLSQDTPASSEDPWDSEVSCRQHSKGMEKLVLKINKKAIKLFGGPSRRKYSKRDVMQGGGTSTEFSVSDTQSIVLGGSGTDEDEKKTKLDTSQPLPDPNIKLRFKIARSRAPSLVHFKMHKHDRLGPGRGLAEYTVLPVASKPQQLGRNSRTGKVMSLAPLRRLGLDLSSMNGEKLPRQRKRPVSLDDAESKGAERRSRDNRVKPPPPVYKGCKLPRRSNGKSEKETPLHSPRKIRRLIRAAKDDEINSSNVTFARPLLGTCKTMSLRSSLAAQKIKVEQEYCSMKLETKSQAKLEHAADEKKESPFYTSTNPYGSTVGGSKRSVCASSHLSLVASVPQPTKHWKKRKVREHETQVFQRRATVDRNLSLKSHGPYFQISSSKEVSTVKNDFSLASN